MHSKLSITFWILEIVSPEGDNCLLSNSVVAPFRRQMNGKKVFHLVGSQYAWLKAEQGAKAVWMLSYFLQNPKCFEAFTESVQRT